MQSTGQFNGHRFGVDDFNPEIFGPPPHPHNLEAERALLGTLLFENRVFHDVCDLVDAQDFYDATHRLIYEGIASQKRAGKAVTPLLLPGLTREQIAYAGTLIVNVTSTKHASDYAVIIRDLAARRRCIDIGHRLVEEARDLALSVPDVGRAAAVELEIVGAQVTSGAGSSYEARSLAAIEPTAVRWLWEGRLPLGKISVLAGDPGLGKSQLSCMLAAAVTTGGTFPDGAEAPLGSVVFICCEDDAADTLRPRLDAAGADIARVHILDWARDGDGTRHHFDVGRHAVNLSAQIRDIGDVRLVVIDPISAYMGRADSHVVADVRRALAPLQSMAAELGPAVLLISHLNKSVTGTAMNRVSGSGAFVASSRSAWLVCADPRDDTKRRRMLVPLKNNLGDDRTGFAYRIEPRHVGRIASSAVVFEAGIVTTTADELLKSATGGHDKGALEEAQEFLCAELRDGPKSSQEVVAAARDAGISSASLRRARQALGVVASKKGPEGAWTMCLPPALSALQDAQGAQGVHPERDE